MRWIRMLFFLLPSLVTAQDFDEQLYGSPNVEVPEVVLDFNGDGIPEIRSGVMTIGTDDVPSSSGTHTFYLKPEKHCSFLTYHPNSSSYQELIWLKGNLPEFQKGLYLWEKAVIAEVAACGYGSAASGWDPVHHAIEGPYTIGVRFEVDGVYWIGTLSWKLVPDTCQFAQLNQCFRIATTEPE